MNYLRWLKTAALTVAIGLGIANTANAAKHILVVSGYPNLEHSGANKAILDELQQKLPEAEYLFLDKIAPTLNSIVR